MRILFLFIFLFISCSDSKIIYNKSDFTLVNGVLNHKGKPYSGKFVRFNGDLKKELNYKNGLLNGWQTMSFSNGKTAKLQFYWLGIKVGIHKSYFSSGKLKAKINFNFKGLHHGAYREWYHNGNPYRYTLYENGEVVGHKVWRKSGKIFSNYIIKNGEKYGLNGGKLCFKTKDRKVAKNGESDV